MQENKPDIFDRIMMLPGLRLFNGFYTKNKMVLMYIFFGGLTTLISIVSFAILDVSCNLNEHVANVISWIFAVSFAYVTNRIWVFQSKSVGKNILKEIFSFFAGRLATIGIEEIILLVFVTWLNLNSVSIKIATQFVVLVLNYFISKIIVFKNKKEGYHEKK